MTCMNKCFVCSFLDDSLEEFNILNDNVLASLNVLRNWKNGGQYGHQN